MLIKFMLVGLVILILLGRIFSPKTFDALCDKLLFFWFLTGVLIILEAVLLWECLPPILYWIISLR